MSDNISQGFKKVEEFFNNGMTKLQNGMQSSNYLDTFVLNGYQGIPIAAFGMVAIFLGVMTYATLADTEHGLGAAAESVGESVSSIQLPSMFSPSSESAEIQKEENDSEEKKRELEEEIKKEEELKGGKKRVSKKRRVSKKKTTKRTTKREGS